MNKDCKIQNIKLPLEKLMLIGLIHNLMKVACRVGPDTVPDAASVPKVNVPGVGVFENCLMNSINSFELPPSLPRKQIFVSPSFFATLSECMVPQIDIRIKEN